MEPIAIVGLSCRFPGASDPAAFWRLLCEGREAIREVPTDRWDVEAFYDADPMAPGKIGTRRGGYLDAVDQFDPLFFRIAPREAVGMDPQQRLLLELAWEALEDAGLVPAHLRGSPTGVFIGLGAPEYHWFQVKNHALINGYTNTGSFPCILANRLSYVFDFRGPSLALDTACSSSLVAVHLACQSLRSGESAVALAGAVSLILAPETAIGYSQLMALSPDGTCKTFDARANGYARGEGAGLVVLKTLSAALDDGDEIYAVIRGSAVNQDGRSNGMTAPNRFSQEEVLRRAYAQAEVAPADVQYVEAHGTGTLLGDPIEAAALGAVVGAGRPADRPCAIGSVKTNFGHLESAAGIVSLIKVALALRHRTIPPSLNFETPNPYIPFDESRLRVQQRLEPWPDGPALAGVSAFGLGGTNAHAVLAEAPPRDDPGDPPPTGRAHLLPVSAHTPEALKAMAQSYVEALPTDPKAVGDFCATVARHRGHHDYRLAVVADDGPGLVERLRAFAADRPAAGTAAGRRSPQKVAFLFTGQGAQYAHMGRRLFETRPVFRETLQRCDHLLRPHLDRPLLSVLFPEDGADAALDETAYTQPALFALEYSLAQQWRAWGVEPDAVLGHSVGEYVAACVAGVLSLEDALPLIAERGRLMQMLPAGGAMAAVFADERRVAAALAPYADEASVAAVNGPENVVVSGSSRAIDAILAALAADNAPAKRLKVSHAFHSPLLEPALDALEQAATDLRFAAPHIRLVSNLTGELVNGTPTLDAAYWRRHSRQPVQFAAGVRALYEHGCRAFVEIGPGPTLIGMAKRCLPGEDCAWLPSLQPGRDDDARMLESLGSLYARGSEVDWHAVHNAPRRRARLPAYPFQRERVWLDVARPAASVAAVEKPEPPALPPRGRRLRSAAPVFESHLRAGAWPFRSGGGEVPPLTYLELARAAAEQALAPGSNRIADVTLHAPLTVSEDGPRTVQVTLSESGGMSATFQVFSLEDADGSWTRHASGRIVAAESAGAPTPLDAIVGRCPDQLDPRDARPRDDANGLQQLMRGEREAVGLIELPEAAGAGLHPAAWGACVAVIAAAASSAGPVALTSVAGYRVVGRAAGRLCAHATVRPGALVADLRLYDEDGQLVAELDGLTFRRLIKAPPPGWRYELRWRPRPNDAANRPATSARPDVVIVADRSGVAAALSHALQERGRKCVVVDSAEQLGESLANHSAAALDVIQCAALDAAGVGELTLVGLQDSQAVGCGSVLALLHALPATDAAVHLWLVTRGAQAVGDAAPVEVAQAPVWGLAHALRWERPDLDCRTVDLDPTQPAADGIAALADEIAAPGPENQIAFRGGQAWVPRLDAAEEDANPNLAAIRPDGTYLVTGGLGGLGLCVAQWLVDRGAHNLVLVGRSAPTADAEQRLTGWRQSGIDVVAAQVDVAQSEQVANLLAKIHATRPPLHGVIHAAGVLDDGLLAQQSWQCFEAVLAPKVAGAWNLHALTADAPLDFFVLFSSVVALVGAPGQGNYAAANAFLDALAHHRRARGLPALSINWGPWAAVGMAAARSKKRARFDGLEAIAADDGVRMLDRLIGGSAAQVAALRADRPRLLAVFPDGTVQRLLSELAAAPAARRSDWRDPFGGGDAEKPPPGGRTGDGVAPATPYDDLTDEELANRLAAKLRSLS